MTTLTDATAEPDVLVAAPFPPPTPLIATSAPLIATAIHAPPSAAGPVFAPPTLNSGPTPAVSPTAAPALVAATPLVIPDASSAPPAAPPLATPPIATPPPTIVTGPSAVLTADPTCAPLPQNLPALPTLAANPKPPNTAAAALGAVGKQPPSLQDLQLGVHKKKPKRGAGSGLKKLMTIGVIGALGYAGYTYGPDLYEQYIEAETDVSANEPEAPLTFPLTPIASPPMRTAEFILSDLTESPGTEYHVTVDFETNVSRVVVMRDDGPDLEVLTFGADAVVHRVGEPTWYRVERGTFPLDERLDRADWVRTLDELIPPEIRGAVQIERATESMIDNVQTRHLFVTLDPNLLTDARLPVSELDPATGLPTQPIPLDDQALDNPLLGETIDLGANSTTPAIDSAPDRPTAGQNTPSNAITVEIWVDANGLVRRISGAPQLGAQTITVLSTSEEGFVPDFPADELTLPLTASALVELGM